MGGVPQYMLSERKIERKIAEIKRHLKKSFQRTMWPGRLDYIFGGLMSYYSFFDDVYCSTFIDSQLSLEHYSVLPLSQYSPTKPSGQTQIILACSSSHVPPFSQWHCFVT